MIYFIKPVGMAGPIKIGFTQDCETRLHHISMWSPFPLEIAATCEGDLALERNIHSCFADAHSHCEWFHPIRRLTLAIEEIEAGAPVHEAINLSDIRGNVLGKTQAQTRARNGTVLGRKHERTSERRAVSA